MEKNNYDFENWNKLKQKSERTYNNKFFKIRDIWWCKLGCNLGHEQDGKGEQFERPILIIKKFNNRIFWALPLTTKNKENVFYFKIKTKDGLEVSVILLQIRLMDVSRLNEKIESMSQIDFQNIKKAIKDML